LLHGRQAGCKQQQQQQQQQLRRLRLANALSFVDMYNKYKAKFLISSIISTDYCPACVRIWTWIDK